MTYIVIDGSAIRDRESMHTLLAQRLSLPDWYGKNLDALYDCLTDTKDMTVVLRNAESMTAALGGYGEAVLRVLRDAAAENPRFGFIMI